MDGGEGEDTKKCWGEGYGAAAEVGKWEDFKEFICEEGDLKYGRLERGRGATRRVKMHTKHFLSPSEGAID